MQPAYFTGYAAPLTTLCPGNTQIAGPLTFASNVTVMTTTGTASYPTAITQPNEPSCSIQPSDCASLASSYSLAYDTWSAGPTPIDLSCDNWIDVDDGVKKRGNGHEVVSTATPTPSAGAESASASSVCNRNCYILGSNIEVMYFPTATATSRDLCGAWPTDGPIACPYGTVNGNGVCVPTATVTSTGNISNTGAHIVSAGTTFFESMVYLSIQSAWAVNDCGTTIGSGHTGGLISLHSSELYSMCLSEVQASTNGGVRSINWGAYPYHIEDLSGYVPASAWNCLPYCSFDFKGEIIANGKHKSTSTAFYLNNQSVVATGGGYCLPQPSQAWYKPWIYVPPQIRDLDPAWATCQPELAGWYDPPVELPLATTADGPSGPHTVSMTAAPQPTTRLVTPTSAAPVRTTRTSEPSGVPPTPEVISSLATTDPQASAVPQDSSPDSTLPDTAPSTNTGNAIPASSDDPEPAAKPTPADDPASPSETRASLGDPADPPATSQADTPDIIATGPAAMDPGDAGSTAVSEPTTSKIPNVGGVIVSLVSVIQSSLPADPSSAQPTVGEQPGPALGDGTGHSSQYSGTTLLALPSGSGVAVVASGITQMLPDPGQAGIQTLTGGGFVFSGQTVLPGGSLAVAPSAGPTDGTTLIAQSAGSGIAVVANGMTRTVAASAIAGLQTLEDGGFFIDGQTVEPGSSIGLPPAATGEGRTTYYAPATGSGLVIAADGVTSTLVDPGQAGAQSLAGGGFVVDGHTVTPGGSLTMASPSASGTGEPITYYALASGSGLVAAADGMRSTITDPAEAGIQTLANGGFIVDGQTVSPGGSVTVTPAKTVQVDGQTFTVLPGSDGKVVVDGVTLTIAGAATVIDGETVSAGLAGVQVGPTLVPYPLDPAGQHAVVVASAHRSHACCQHRCRSKRDICRPGQL